MYSFSQSMKISQALSYIRWTRNIQQSVHTTKCTVPIDFCLLNTTIKTIVKNSLSKITRPRMIEHTDVHFHTHWNVAKRSWHFLPLRFVPMYINYAMFYERVYVVAGRSSWSLFQVQCRWWRPESERHAKSWRGGKNEKLKGYRACNHLFLYWLITYCIFCVKPRIPLLNKPFAPR